MSQINIRTDNVAELMSTVSNMMRQIDNVSSQLKSNMRYIDNSIKSQSNINYRMNCVCNKLSETYNRLSSLLSVMDMAVNTYNDAEQQVIYLTKDLQDIYGRDGSSFLNGVISNIQSFADEVISEVKDIYSDAENTVKNVEKWYDDNKEYIDKLLIDGAVLVVSAALFVLAPEAAPLIFAADAYLLAKNAVQVCADGVALIDNIEGKTEEAKDVADTDYMKIGVGDVARSFIGVFGMLTTKDIANGFKNGYNSDFAKKAGDLVYDGVDTTANVISLKNSFKNGSEIVNTANEAATDTSKFSEFINKWNDKNKAKFGEDNIKIIEKTKEIKELEQKGYDAVSNENDAIDDPSNTSKYIEKSLGDLPVIGDVEADIFGTFDDITSDFGIKTSTNQQK